MDVISAYKYNIFFSSIYSESPKMVHKKEYITEKPKSFYKTYDKNGQKNKDCCTGLIIDIKI